VSTKESVQKRVLLILLMLMYVIVFAFHV